MNPTTANLERIEDWLEKLASATDAAMLSDELNAYFRATRMFWRYSWGNRALIFLQMPTASRVGGQYKLWAQLGYKVKPDERAIAILRPVKRKIKDEQTGEERKVATGQYWTCYVYDESQVEPARPDAAPLHAPFYEIVGDWQGLYHTLAATCRRLGVIVEQSDHFDRDTHGLSNGMGRIIVSSRDDLGNRVHVLVHELAHEIVHPVTAKMVHHFSKQEVECQAEAVAFCVAEALGLPSPNSGIYMALYKVDRKVLRDNLGAIERGVRTILENVQAVIDQRQPKAA